MFAVPETGVNAFTFAALFNRRQEGSTPSCSGIDPLLNQAASAVTTWPATDRFSAYFQSPCRANRPGQVSRVPLEFPLCAPPHVPWPSPPSPPPLPGRC
ncbi:hypothetical protein [Nonomuraea sp. B19D2]|uniref:hypothetical protein n=1 Tax=Nonomuraea sp. B19D2 TaxID=3159561 RepID=UPI0032D9C5F4